MIKKIKYIIVITFLWILAYMGSVLGYDDKIAVVDYFDTTAETKVTKNTTALSSLYAFDFENVDVERTLLDHNKNLNFVYRDNDYVYIQKLNANNKTEKTLKIKKLYPLYGGITIDSSGNYYIAWGQQDNSSEDEVSGIITFAISKHDNNGNFIKSYEYSETEPLRQSSATKTPFHLGSCQMAINSEGILSFHYTHLMKSGHQGNETGTINTKTMEDASEHRGGVFVSHCMYDDVIPYEKTKGFAFIGQRDATKRGYNIGVSYKRTSGVWSGKWYADEMVPFRFRGSGSCHYNNTFAHYGGMAELDTGLAVVAASDTTLDKPATSRWSESRNLFIQIIKNDYITSLNSSNQKMTADAFVTKGERKSVISGDSDYGVQWLTNYKNDYSVSNVKTLKVDNDRIAILYTETPLKCYREGNYTLLSSNNKLYYMVVDNKGNIVQEATYIPTAQLPIDGKIAYKNGYVYFSNSDGTTNIRTYRVKLYDTQKVTLDISTKKHTFTSLSQTLQLTAKLSNNEDTEFSWNSSNEKVLKVDQNGKVTPIKGGFANITATDGKYGKSITCRCYVQVPVTLSDGSKAYVGDMNRDGFFNSTDSSIIQEAYKNGATADQALIGDVNGDGYVNSTDSSFILDIFASGEFSPGRYYPITEFELNKMISTLEVGKSEILKATITPENTTDSTVITWKSSNPSVVKVDSTGKITAIKTGVAIISAEAGGKAASCRITVTEPTYPLQSISLDKTNVSLTVGETSTLKVTYNPSNTTDSKTVTWTSSNTAVATVDSTGKITAVGAGTAIITAKVGTKTATCRVNNIRLVYPLQSISLNKTDVNLAEGGTTTLKVTYNPTNTTDNKTVTWTSNNTGVAKVDSTGKITAVKVGTATITAKVGTKTATCQVKVIRLIYPLQSISLDKTSVNLTVGGTSVLTVTYNPTKTTDDKTVTWTSSNAAIAKVDSTGKITAVKAGTATITAKVGTKTATCKVIVAAPTYPLQSISLDKTSVNLTVGGTNTLKVTYNPSNTTDNKVVTWTSSNTAIAKVDSTGKITAVSAGTATITAKVGTKTATCKVTVVNPTYPLQSISLDKTSVNLTVGGTNTLKVTYNPTNTTDNKTVTWTSNNTGIAKVDSTGKITAVSAGTATITAKVGTKTATCKVTVVNPTYPLQNISLNKTTLTVNEDAAATLKVTYNPSNTTDSKAVTWTSSNSKVATVDKNGNVRGIEEGTATITAKVGSKTATCKVTVEYVLPFKDVPKDSWYYNSVKYTYKRGIIAGYNSTTFAPFDNVTRGQLVTMLWRRENKPDTSKLKNNFTDVPEKGDYTQGIKWANAQGIVKGYGGTTKFGPGDPITRQDLAIVLNKYAKYKGKNATGTASLTRFKDYKTVSDYAENAVKWTVQNGIISGNSLPDGSKTIAPHDNATRAEIAVMLQKFFEKFN